MTNDVLSFQMALTLDELIKASGGTIYKRLNLTNLLGIGIQAMRGNEKPVECTELLGEIQALRSSYKPIMDLEAYITEEKAIFEKFLYETIGRELSIINRDKLISGNIMSRMIGERFGLPIEEGMS